MTGVPPFADPPDIDESALEERFVRASGPGGQNVNMVSSAVELRFDAARASGLDGGILARLLALAGRRANRDGVIVIFAQRFRDQERNRADARARLRALIARAAEPPPPERKPTRPGRAARARRVDAKKRRGAVKRLRGQVDQG